MPNLLRAFKNKITNKLFGVVHLPAQGTKKGDVLLSYLTGPFTLAPGEFFTDPHSGYWECAEIARLFVERGYAVDVIQFDNKTFLPRKPYTTVVDILQNLERLSPSLKKECKKVLHIVCSYPEAQNRAEARRLEQFAQRRRTTLSSQRAEPVSKNPSYADFLEGFGNKTVHATYAQFQKHIYPIPISVAKEFDFPAQKNFAEARKHFLWFGGGGAVLKGLDLVIEAFAQMPRLTLHIVGPSAYEKEFAKAYEQELALPNIKRYPRPKLTRAGEMLVGEVPFLEIANRCAALIYPSASEGTSGSVVQAMHAGVVPIVTPQTGLQEDAPAILMQAPTVESIRAQAETVAHTEPAALAQHARSVWEYARAHHTKATFSTAYAHFIDDILKL